MKVTAFTRSALKTRRQKRDLTAAGYRYKSIVDMSIHNGADWDKQIADVIIGEGGNSIFYKVIEREKA